MPSQFYSIAEPTPVEGPRIMQMDGPQWDRAEVTLLCQGDRSAQGGFSKGQAFPGAPGLIISEVETSAAARGGYLVRLGGKGIRDGRQRVYSSKQCYTNSEQATDVQIGGVPYSTFQRAWPAVDLMLSQVGFRQVIVGAPSLLSQNFVGRSVGAPPVGSFPAAPDNPWDSVDKPLLHYPWGWVLARIESEPLLDGAFTEEGPWIATYEYVFRWKITYGG